MKMVQAQDSDQSDAIARLQPHLVQGEHVLWAGNPDPKVWLTRMDLLYVPFSLIFCGFLVFMLVLAAQSHDPAATAFVALIALPGLWLLFGRFVYKRYRKTRTAYGITSERAIIAVGANVRTKSPLRGKPICVRKSRDGRHASVEIGGPVGVATTAPAANTGLDSYHFYYYRSRQAQVPFSFYDIEHPDAMLNALKRAGATRDTP